MTPTHTDGPLVYLDLNHWINLSKARVGHEGGGRYARLYEFVRELVAAGRARFVLSGEHYFEIAARIQNFRQRNDIALTMAELTRYATLASRDLLLEAEFRRALMAVLGRRLTATVVPPVGHGGGHAFGHEFVGHITGPGSDDPGRFDEHAQKMIVATEAMVGGGWSYSGPRDLIHGKELIEAVFNEAAQFTWLRGPRPEDIDRLREYGFRPEEAVAMVDGIAAREQHMAKVLNEGKDQRRVDDLIGASTYVFDLNPTIVPKALGDLGLPPDHLVWLGKARMTELLRRTPILDVEMALRRGNLKAREYTITRNDIYDMAALGVAVVYCDVVVTDRSAAHRLKAAGVDARYSCRVMSSPDELIGELNGVRVMATG